MVERLGPAIQVGEEREGRREKGAGGEEKQRRQGRAVLWEEEEGEEGEEAEAQRERRLTSWF